MKIERSSSYFKWGITAFCVIGASIILYFMIERMDAILTAVNVVSGILTPFILGLVLAYLLCPLYNLTKRGCAKVPWPKFMQSKKNPDDPYSFLKKLIATVVSLLTFFALVVGLLAMILPQLIESVVTIAAQLPDWINASLNSAEKYIKDVPEVRIFVDETLNSMSSYFSEWVQNTLIPNSEEFLNQISQGILGVFAWVVDIFVAVIICVFFLNSKEIFAAQIKKLLFALTNEENVSAFLRGSAFVNRTFNSFITGKLLDSLIVGIICFTVMMIFGWPFAALVSVIIGVTNIIPFFGPFIGAIPSSLLIIMIDPMTGVYFIIFILILQQVDGNIIGPKILGNSTGLSSFWVLFAILVGGGLFSFVGMIIGIPLFACIYAYICFKINRRLERKGLSTKLEDYSVIKVDLSTIDKR